MVKQYWPHHGLKENKITVYSIGYIKAEYTNCTAYSMKQCMKKMKFSISKKNNSLNCTNNFMVVSTGQQLELTLHHSSIYVCFFFCIDVYLLIDVAHIALGYSENMLRKKCST